MEKPVTNCRVQKQIVSNKKSRQCGSGYLEIYRHYDRHRRPRVCKFQCNRYGIDYIEYADFEGADDSTEGSYWFFYETALITGYNQWNESLCERCIAQAHTIR